MTASVPVVQLFQEAPSFVVTAETPQQQSLILGPAYHLLDYPADEADIGIGQFGSDTAASDAIDGSPVGQPSGDFLIVSDPPNNVTGAVLDSTSVEIWAQDTLVLITSGIDGTCSATPPDENLFTSAGSTFVTDGVAVGDRVVLTEGATTILKTVLTVVSETDLRLSSNVTAAGIDINGDPYTGVTWTGGATQFRVERALTTAQEFPSAGISIAGNVVTLSTPFELVVGGVTRTVTYADLYMEYRSLRQDLADVNVSLTPAAIESAVGPIDERNPLAVGLHVAHQNTATTMLYYGITTDDLAGYQAAFGFLAARGDIYAISVLSESTAVAAALKTHTEGLAAPELGNLRLGIGAQEIPSQGIISLESITGQSEEVAGDDVDILSIATADFSAVPAAANGAILDIGLAGRTAAFVVEEVLNDNKVRATTAFSAAASTAANYYILDEVTAATVLTAGDGDYNSASPSTFTLTAGEALSTWVGQVLRITNPSAPNQNQSPAGNDDYLITAVDEGTDTITVLGDPGTTQASLNLSIIPVYDSDASGPGVASVTRQAFRRLLDTNATFVSDGVIVGDLIEIPEPAVNAGADFTGTLFSAAVTQIISDNRILFAAGTDLPTVSDAAQTDIGYRVVRTLSRQGQADALAAQTFESKRLAMAFPDSVGVSGVTNAKTGTATPQPGYYAGAALAGMIAGTPPHQGLSNTAVAGIDRVYRSSNYFSYDQLATISNAGWFVLVQPEPSALPTVLHQLTTDVSTLGNGEISMVRSVDFASTYFKNIAKEFLGKYNVTEETLRLISDSLNHGITTLRSRKLPRIGSVILGGFVESVTVVDGAPDSVECVIPCDFPAPLNRVILRVIA